MEIIEKLITWFKGKTLLVVSIFVFFIILLSARSLFENVLSDEIVINQVPVTGTLEFWTDPGLKLQMFGNIQSYDKSFQIWFSSKKDQGRRNDESIKIIFNDAGIAWISGSARILMPRDEKNLKRVHTNFGSMQNLIHELVIPTMNKVVFSSGPLMSSYESYAVKKNDLIRYIEDQLQFGIYKTLSRDVKRKDELTGKEKVVTIAELIPSNDAPGGYKRQEVAPLSKYGIKIAAVSVEDIRYDSKIMQQISAQQQALMDVQTSIAEAKKAKQETIKAEEQGKAEAARAKWEQEKINAKEIAEAEKKKRVAQLAMEEARYQKQADILAGQGIAAKKKLIMQADGALEKKLEAWVKVNSDYAQALSKYEGNLVPQIITGGSSKGNITSAQQLMEFFMIKTANDLKIDMNLKGKTGK